MKVRILESARQDLREGYRFYEQQQRGIGDYFLDMLSAEIDSLALYGGIHGMRLGHHRLLSGRFPFAVYYRIERGEVVVRAVLDCRRNPTWIRKRLR
ncbi:MAG: type II toxin-antitoxin system RelE/ParE family toxin [Verrucomicrobiales bacterium]|nr:type II toxin-antitoxin system RelE/ParE family toxin [Verrucomicrobiales bacterium]